MPYSPRVKQLAYLFDPLCWKSYSGKSADVKRQIDARRSAALDWADENIWRLPAATLAGLTSVFGQPWSEPMSPLKLQMMLHFYAVCEPFAPEKTRTSPAYTQFVRELLRDGLIERPTKEQQKKCPGWAYRATEKGRVFVQALLETPMPVAAKPKWVMPER